MLSEKRRALGAFYTPADLAAVVADWAIDRPNLRVLEPSVGSGVLIDATLNKFAALGGGTVVGYEIDAATVKTLERFQSNSCVEIHCADFFDVPADSSFDRIIANPPFTRNHQLSPELRQALRSREDSFKVARGASGLWVYFLLAGLAHLRRGGGLAFVVPGASEFADYAVPILEHLRQSFSSVELISIESAIDWDGDAQARASVLLASGYGAGPAEEVVRLRKHPDGSDPLPEAVLPVLPAATMLGSLARLEIGSVTGANDIFLLSHQDIVAADLNIVDFTPAAAKARHVSGISVRRGDLVGSTVASDRTWLLTPSEIGPRGGPLRKYLARVSKNRRKNTIWFNKRSPWWQVALGPSFDAVLTYMNHVGPRIAIVDPGIAATNTLHKVTFLSRDRDIHRSICVSLLTTYSQLHAEAIGRVYGGGVLKFELKDARRLPVLVPSQPLSEATFARVDTALRAGAIETARSLADAAILPEFLGAGWGEAVLAMSAQLTRARARRSGKV